MKNELANDPGTERYIVEIDGIATLEYRVFIRALTAGLRLKRDLPHSDVKLRETGKDAAPRAH